MKIMDIERAAMDLFQLPVGTVSAEITLTTRNRPRVKVVVYDEAASKQAGVHVTVTQRFELDDDGKKLALPDYQPSLL